MRIELENLEKGTLYCANGESKTNIEIPTGRFCGGEIAEDLVIIVNRKSNDIEELYFDYCTNVRNGWFEDIKEKSPEWEVNNVNKTLDILASKGYFNKINVKNIPYNAKC